MLLYNSLTNEMVVLSIAVLQITIALPTKRIPNKVKADLWHVSEQHTVVVPS